MNTIIETSVSVNPLSEIIATVNDFGPKFRYLTICQTKNGKVLLRSSQAGALVLDFFPTYYPALGLTPLAIARFDRAAQAWIATATATKAQIWLDEAAELLGEPAPAQPDPTPTHPADELAAELTRQYPKLAGRIASAVEIVKSGKVANEHNTTYYPQGRGLWTCGCQDAQYRNLRFDGGVACKHTLACYISQRLEAEAEAVAYRHLADKTERRRPARRSESTPATPLPTISREAAAAMAARLDATAAKSAANARAQAQAMKPGGAVASYEFQVKRGRS